MVNLSICTAIVPQLLEALNFSRSYYVRQSIKWLSLRWWFASRSTWSCKWFCIYNDIAITAQYLAKEYNQRVLIIDTDAHHGDGTQWSFYADNHVTTYSIHETGKFLSQALVTILNAVKISAMDTL